MIEKKKKKGSLIYKHREKRDAEALQPGKTYRRKGGNHTPYAGKRKKGR